MIVCSCNVISSSEIEAAVEELVQSEPDVVLTPRSDLQDHRLPAEMRDLLEPCGQADARASRDAQSGWGNRCRQELEICSLELF